MKKIFQKLRDRLEGGLRGVCGRINPDRRVIVIVVIVALFALVNIYVTFSAIFSIGRGGVETPRIEITPIEVPDFGLDDDASELRDSLETFFEQHFNTDEYDTTDSQKEAGY